MRRCHIHEKAKKQQNGEKRARNQDRVCFLQQQLVETLRGTMPTGGEAMMEIVKKQ